MYRVIKVLNNNGVLALDMEKKQEVILLGNGVGFGKKMGQRFGGSQDARRYELVKKETSALQAVNGIDPVYIEVTARIIEAAEGLLGPIRHDILIAMADHIALAVSRAKEGCELPNPFSQDIRALFSQEYEAALKGRELIRQELGVEISEDEVSYITLHIHGGLSDENVSQSPGAGPAGTGRHPPGGGGHGNEPACRFPGLQPPDEPSALHDRQNPKKGADQPEHGRLRQGEFSQSL